MGSFPVQRAGSQNNRNFPAYFFQFPLLFALFVFNNKIIHQGYGYGPRRGNGHGKDKLIPGHIYRAGGFKRPGGVLYIPVMGSVTVGIHGKSGEKNGKGKGTEGYYFGTAQILGPGGKARGIELGGF
jgi:hypothetical protein